MMTSSTKLIAHYDSSGSEQVLASYRFDIQLTRDWLLAFQDTIIAILSQQKLPQTFIDLIINATVEAYENIYRHSQGDNKIIVRIFPSFIEFTFLNRGDLHNERKKRSVEEFITSTWKFRREDVSFGAGTLLLKAHADNYEQDQEGVFVTTKIRKKFPFKLERLTNEHRIPEAEETIPFLKPFQVGIQYKLFSSEG